MLEGGEVLAVEVEEGRSRRIPEDLQRTVVEGHRLGGRISWLADEPERLEALASDRVAGNITGADYVIDDGLTAEL